MKKLRHYILFFLLVLTSPAFGSDFETDSWPGEGIPNFSARNNVLHLYSHPAVTSAQITYEVPKGSKIRFDKSRQITKHSVMLTAKTQVTDVHCEDPTGPKTVINPGETIEYLQYRAEGYITARVKGKICEVFAMDTVPKFEGIEKEPVVEWWVRVADKNKKPQGWLRVDKSQVIFLERSF